jgi:uncharacterized protein YutE (UPF0331/DUF86 family)
MATYDGSFGRAHERAAMRAIIDKFEADGYQIYIEPGRSVLPEFMGHYRPDLIAIKEHGKKIAIELVSNNDSRRLEKISKIFAEHKDWELKVFYVSKEDAEQMQAHTKDDILKVVDALESMAEKYNGIPALLTAWAAFEATGRALLPNRLGMPQTPSQLVETLAAEGYVTPDDADKLRVLVKLRNRAAHGALDTIIDRSALTSLIDTVKSLQAIRRDDSSISGM